MSSFYAVKLDILPRETDTSSMAEALTRQASYGRITNLVRKRIETAGERIWRLDDFQDLPSSAVAQVLSRMTRQGLLQRLSKGTYYHPRQTPFGKSLPNPTDIQKLASRRSTIFPSGTAAANLLGFTTQTSRRGEVATSGLSLPKKLIGHDTVIHIRRPQAWAGLTETDAALLDFLRRAGRTSELSSQDTVRRTLALIAEKGRFERLLAVTETEPPRVRAILGAIGQSLKKQPAKLHQLQTSLNPFSHFDFGLLAGLPHARDWQAKNPRS